MDTLFNIATRSRCFNTLLIALETAKLLEILQTPGDYTILAPTDEAFAKISANTINAWIADIPTINKIVRYHIILGNFRTENFLELGSVETMKVHLSRLILLTVLNLMMLR
jgi:uncharacterized surface protein with fasciclin (FAS1) repeats